ncbi:hypothetical protein [Parvimonas sp. G1967]|uniref:DUF7675 family protein n=1 Tax=Parvimonas sp. G1967 TaxID=3387695 RepID=UPI0039E2E5DE
MSNNFYKDLEKYANEKDTIIYVESGLDGYSDFYKENEKSRVWWIDNLGVLGEHLFSFDKKKIYNIFLDYPHNLTEEEKKIFDEDEPYWREFFKNR